MDTNKLTAITMGDREKWLRKWAKSHEYDFSSNDQRNTFIYYYYLTVQSAYGKAYADEYTVTINKCFTKPIEDKELTRKMHLFSSNKYRNLKFRNETIIKALGITETEVIALEIGHNLKEKAERKVRKAEKTERNTHIIRLFNSGVPIPQICEMQSVSLATANRILSKYKKELKQVRNEKILEQYLLGRSVSEISKEMHCSEDTVRKIIKNEKNSLLTITEEISDINGLEIQKPDFNNKLFSMYTQETLNTTDDEQVQALYILSKTVKNVWIQGSAGTGKTYLISKYLSTLTEKQFKRTCVVASTGLVANNIGGITIHNAFNLPSCVQIPSRITAIPKALKNIDTIIIDEISTVRADVFTKIMQLIKYIQRKEHKKIRLIVVGDYGQIKPVLTTSDAEIFKNLYPELIDCYAFDSPMWEKAHFTKIVLHNVYRQNDAEYVYHLSGVKYGNFNDAVWFMNNQTQNELKHPIYICAKRKTVNEYNNSVLKSFDKSKLKEYKAIYTDEPNTELPCAKVITLAKGARVMTLCNTPNYKNGSIGTVKRLYSQSVVIEFDTGETVTVTPQKFNLTDGSTYIQLPLMLAYAITVHKSQGCTFDEVAIVCDGYFEVGMLYVAISRCRSLEGLSFIGKLTERDLIVDERALAKTLSYYK